MKKSWDVIVVGAGAAGLWAAATAAQRNRDTLLVEKNRKLGVKILMSGGTRCNLTQHTTWKGIAEAFGSRQGRFLKFALATLPPEAVVQQFHDWGVATKVEPTGKIFPESDRAIDVRDALVERTLQSGAQILAETSVTGIRKQDEVLLVPTSRGVFSCQSLILTSGGQSYPGCGTSGDGYGWLSELGHSIVTPRPALTPVRVQEQWARDLAGVTIADARLQVRMHGIPAKKAASERNSYRGSFLFTHKGCSGPAVLNISRMITDPAHNVPKSLICDWLPSMDEESWRQTLSASGTRAAARTLGNVINEHLPKRLVMQLCELAEVPLNQSLAEISRRQLGRIIQQTKHCPLTINGTLGFAKAEVTAGGVALEEIDSQTMRSKIVPGLFLAGEILDVDGPIGGYNFQAAFSTGFVAGTHA